MNFILGQDPGEVRVAVEDARAVGLDGCLEPHRNHQHFCAFYQTIDDCNIVIYVPEETVTANGKLTVVHALLHSDDGVWGTLSVSCLWTRLPRS